MNYSKNDVESSLLSGHCEADARSSNDGTTPVLRRGRLIAIQGYTLCVLALLPQYATEIKVKLSGY